MGEIQGAAAGVSAAASTYRPFELSRSEIVIRGAGCGKSARPDLRGAAAQPLAGLPLPYTGVFVFVNVRVFMRVRVVGAACSSSCSRFPRADAVLN